MAAETKELHGSRKQTVEVVDFSDAEELPLKPAAWLSPKAQDIYKEVRRWLKKMGCTRGILPRHLEEFAHLKAKWHECEDQVKNVGMIIKEDGKVKANPFMQFAQSFLKQSNEVWAQIYLVVRDTKSTSWTDDPNSDDVMEQILSGRWDKERGAK
jgi:phage terminase small subunit